MTLELTPRRQAVLALSIAGVIMLAALLLVAWPIWNASAAHADQIDILRRQVLRMKGMAEVAPRYETLLKQVGNNPEIQQLTIAAPQATLAVAQLQSKIGQIFTAAGATISASQAMPETKTGGLTKVTVQANIEADVKALTAVLHAIDEARPLLEVERLTIRDPDGEWASLPQSTVPAGPNKLQAEMTVSAYMRAP